MVAVSSKFCKRVRSDPSSKKMAVAKIWFRNSLCAPVGGEDTLADSMMVLRMLKRRMRLQKDRLGMRGRQIRLATYLSSGILATRAMSLSLDRER